MTVWWLGINTFELSCTIWTVSKIQCWQNKGTRLFVGYFLMRTFFFVIDMSYWINSTLKSRFFQHFILQYPLTCGINSYNIWTYKSWHSSDEKILHLSSLRCKYLFNRHNKHKQYGAWPKLILFSVLWFMYTCWIECCGENVGWTENNPTVNN